MVAARTAHLDRLVATFESTGKPYQVLNVGAGLDFRRWRLAMTGCQSYVELDLPSLAQEKAVILDQLALNRSLAAQVSTDLLIDLPDRSVVGTTWDSSLPTLVWWEGGSMYFPEERCREIVSSIARLLGHPDSRLWFDFVRRDLIDRTERVPRAVAFIDAMQKMGEPFINGFDDVEAWLSEQGLSIVDDAASGTGDVFDLYRFAVVRRAQTS